MTSQRALLRGTTLTGAAIILTALLSGCSVPTNLFSGDAQRDDKGNVTDGSSIDIFKLKVGDCKTSDDPNSTEVSDTNVVPCDEAHDEEVYAEFTLPDGELPVGDAMDAAADPKCGEEFTKFVGVDYETSKLDYAYFTPTAAGWKDGDRLIQCVLYADDESQLTGSMKGSGA